jgi:hypothetical protein
MAISTDQKPGNRLRHTPANSSCELARTTASAGSTDTAIPRLGTPLNACMDEIYIIDMGLGLTISRLIIEKAAASCSMTTDRPAYVQIHTSTV